MSERSDCAGGLIHEAGLCKHDEQAEKLRDLFTEQPHLAAEPGIEAVAFAYEGRYGELVGARTIAQAKAAFQREADVRDTLADRGYGIALRPAESRTAGVGLYFMWREDDPDETWDCGTLDQIAKDLATESDEPQGECRYCRLPLIPGYAEEAGQWRDTDGRYFCAVAGDALHHLYDGPLTDHGHDGYTCEGGR